MVALYSDVDESRSRLFLIDLLRTRSNLFRPPVRRSEIFTFLSPLLIKMTTVRTNVFPTIDTLTHSYLDEFPSKFYDVKHRLGRTLIDDKSGENIYTKTTGSVSLFFRLVRRLRRLGGRGISLSKVAEQQSTMDRKHYRYTRKREKVTG